MEFAHLNWGKLQKVPDRIALTQYVAGANAELHLRHVRIVSICF
jgi:hypothetical protein